MIILEIGNNTVKILWGRAKLKDFQIANVVIKRIQQDSPESLAEAITSTLDKKTLKKFKPVVLSIPRNQATLRNLKFPSKDKRELDNIVSLHLTQQVPYSREEIIHNYQILEEDSPGYTEILLGIVHRKLLIKSFAALEKLNLSPENVLLSTCGLREFLRKARILKDNDQELKACVDVASDYSDFVIFRSRNILFSKSIPIGASQLKDEDKLVKFIGEIKQAMVVFQTDKRGSVTECYISGASLAETSLKPGVRMALNLPVSTLRPENVVTSLKKVEGYDKISNEVSITSLLGMALDPLSDKLNFVLPEAKLRKDVKLMTRNFVVLGSVVAYLLVLMLLGFSGKIYTKQGFLSAVKDEARTLEAKNSLPIKALDKIKAVRGFTRQKDSVLYYYYELTKVIPDNITVDRLIYTKAKEFSMVGRGTDMGEIFNFVRVLNDAGIFGKVELRYSRKKISGDAEFNEFEIMCHID